MSFIRRPFFFKYCVLNIECPSSEVPLYIIGEVVRPNRNN